MAHRNPCDFCPFDSSHKVGFEEDIPQSAFLLAARLHRRYSLRSAQALRKYLSYLRDNVTNADRHIHFSQLISFADDHGGQRTLDWTSSRGRFLEAIHHITMDTHLSKCHQEVGGCRRLHTRVDDWQYHSFSRQPSICRSCSITTVDGWVEYKREQHDISRMGGFKMAKDPIHACTVDLDLGVNRANLRPIAVRCSTCGLFPPMAEDMVTGRSSLINIHHQAGVCMCPFSCIRLKSRTPRNNSPTVTIR